MSTPRSLFCQTLNQKPETRCFNTKPWIVNPKLSIFTLAADLAFAYLALTCSSCFGCCIFCFRVQQPLPLLLSSRSCCSQYCSSHLNVISAAADFVSTAVSVISFAAVLAATKLTAVLVTAATGTVLAAALLASAGFVSSTVADIYTAVFSSDRASFVLLQSCFFLLLSSHSHLSLFCFHCRARVFAVIFAPVVLITAAVLQPPLSLLI